MADIVKCVEILPYHAFTFEIYNELKKFLKEKK